VSAADNPMQGDFGEAWLGAVASGCGLLHGPSPRPDLEKADVELVLPGFVYGTWSPAVKVQVKTEAKEPSLRDGMYSYDLDVATYNALRPPAEQQSMRRILAVIWLSSDDERVRLQDEGTLLVGRGAWVSLEGLPPTANSSTQVVYLPATNTLDKAGLQAMLSTYGVRSSTPVPDVDVWAVTDDGSGGASDA
jgi:hypothetical protein